MSLHNLLQVAQLRKYFFVVTVLVLLQLSLPIPVAFASTSTSVSSSTSLSTSTSVSNATISSILENPPVSMDNNLFLASVPSYPNIGQNYTVRILVNNNSDEPIPILFRVDVPVDVFDVHPIFLTIVVPPGGQIIGNFTINAFNRSYKGPIVVTATLWIWFYAIMNRPQEVQSLSATVFGVNPSPYSQTVWILSGLAMVIAVCATVLFLKRSGLPPFSSRKEKLNVPPNSSS